jgi:hypothetical protein
MRVVRVGGDGAGRSQRASSPTSSLLDASFLGPDHLVGEGVDNDDEGSASLDADVGAGAGDDLEPTFADLMRPGRREGLPLEAGDDRAFGAGERLVARQACHAAVGDWREREVLDGRGAGVLDRAGGDPSTCGRVRAGEVEVDTEIELLLRAAGGGERDGECREERGADDGESSFGE